MINMKKILFFTTLLFFISFCTNAQKPIKKGDRGAKIKALKIAFLTDELDLTSSEAEKFWPVYNNHNNKTNEFIRNKLDDIRKEIKQAKGVDNLEEKKAIILFDLLQYLEKKKFEEDKKYYSKLKSILTIKKILKLQISEREFRRKLLRKYRGKRK